MRIHTLIGLALLGSACGPDVSATAQADTTEYGEQWDVVVVEGAEDDYVITGAPGSGCVEVEGACYDIADLKERNCDTPEATADLVVGADGELLGAVCYPPPEDASSIEDALVADDDKLELPQTSNGAVITFPPESAGTPLVGDVTLEAERVTLFGRGMDETIIDGHLTLRSNNARARGLTIERDLTIAKNANNTGISFVRVRGNLQIEGNGATVLNAEIFGDIQVGGNDAQLANVGLQGTWQGDARCQGCYSFTDEDQDGILQDTERGEELTRP